MYLFVFLLLELCGLNLVAVREKPIRCFQFICNNTLVIFSMASEYKMQYVRLGNTGLKVSRIW